MKITTDVDIDVYDRNKVLDNLHAIPARIDRENGEYVKHNTGVYFQPIPYDPVTGLASIDHKLAGELGYMKLDFLNNSLYKNVRDEDHLNSLLEMKPMWEMLEYAEFVEKLFHIGEHFDIVKAIKPTSVEDLAVVLALIRPAKRYLLDQPRSVIDREIWIKPEDGYYFKKAHSYSYAVAIVVQMNLMVEQAMLTS